MQKKLLLENFILHLAYLLIVSIIVDSLSFRLHHLLLMML